MSGVNATPVKQRERPANHSPPIHSPPIHPPPIHLLPIHLPPIHSLPIKPPPIQLPRIRPPPVHSPGHAPVRSQARSPVRSPISPPYHTKNPLGSSGQSRQDTGNLKRRQNFPQDHQDNSRGDANSPKSRQNPPKDRPQDPRLNRGHPNHNSLTSPVQEGRVQKYRVQDPATNVPSSSGNSGIATTTPQDHPRGSQEGTATPKLNEELVIPARRIIKIKSSKNKAAVPDLVNQVPKQAEAVIHGTTETLKRPRDPSPAGLDSSSGGGMKESPSPASLDSSSGGVKKKSKPKKEVRQSKSQKTSQGRPLPRLLPVIEIPVPPPTKKRAIDRSQSVTAKPAATKPTGTKPAGTKPAATKPAAKESEGDDVIKFKGVHQRTVEAGLEQTMRRT
ncbi:hypothetical protein BGZ80_006000 [Entomortierella chlamydospora]|uniref:Uncharacterized protein n=1 Tax=Entomortierella chlamydospora TaxID=101097 RepID=A0A9P6MHX4_9FUNG|nr:hypothetical protein BGZ80_006000 [Entomortierella chlamydospora]